MASTVAALCGALLLGVFTLTIADPAASPSVELSPRMTATLRRTSQGQGQHPLLHFAIDILNCTPPSRSTILIRQNLSINAFVDPFELLHRPPFFPLSHPYPHLNASPSASAIGVYLQPPIIDLESAAYQRAAASAPIIATFVIPILCTSTSPPPAAVHSSFTVPIHLRYQRPSAGCKDESGCPFKFTLPPLNACWSSSPTCLHSLLHEAVPQDRCSDVQQAINDLFASCQRQVDNIPHLKVTADDTVFTMPTGHQEHADFVLVATIAVAIATTATLLWQIVKSTTAKPKQA